MEIVRPADRGYAALQHVYSRTGRPGSVLLPRTTAEVVEALSTVRATGRPFAVRSGGHGISSIATNTGGDVIDLRGIASVEHRGGRRSASARERDGARWPGPSRRTGSRSAPATPATSASAGSRPREASG